MGMIVTASAIVPAHPLYGTSRLFFTESPHWLVRKGGPRKGRRHTNSSSGTPAVPQASVAGTVASGQGQGREGHGPTCRVFKKEKTVAAIRPRFRGACRKLCLPASVLFTPTIRDSVIGRVERRHELWDTHP